MAFPLAGLLLSLAGTGLSAGLSAKNNREAREAQQAESARRQAHYEAKANEDPLSRSENQHLLGQYDRDAQQQIENARSMAAIKGATPEYAAAVQKGVAESRANLMGQMSADASQRADKYEEMAEGARQEAAANEQAYHAQRNEQYANLAGNALSAFGSLASASMGGGEKQPAAKAPSMTEDQAKNKLATMQAQSNYQKYLETGIPDPSWSQAQIDAYKAMKGIDDKGGFGAIQRSLTH